MNHSSPSRRALVVLVILPLLLVGCGGRSGSLPSGDDGGSSIAPGSSGGLVGVGCAPLDCPPEAPFDPDLCACILADDGGTSITVDAQSGCPPIVCPQGTFYEMVQGECICASYAIGDDGGEDAPSDAWVGYDAPYYYDNWVPPAQDAPYYYYDNYVPPPADAPYCGYYNYCGAGYVLNAACQCVACSNTCPADETPTADCSGCQPCTTACPAGFKVGYSCGCVPDGVDAGPPPATDAGPDSGVTCQLEGYYSCAAGSWCSLGTCPDGKTQYGCYCNPDGTATCNLACPAPPSCSIPGLGSCPSGQTCAYGTCSSESASLLVCSCQYYGGSAYCSTYSCADGGPTWLPEAGTYQADAGPSCWLQGYTQCPAGQYCSLGTCPNGSAYGCTCNADGTTDCNLACPPPAPCEIPGEGTCPYGQTCTFGSCDGGATAVLSCSCYGGGANCYTNSCP